MNLAVFASDPDAGRNARGVAYEPSVGVVVGRTCLAGYFPFQPVFGAKAYSRTVVYYPLEGKVLYAATISRGDRSAGPTQREYTSSMWL